MSHNHNPRGNNQHGAIRMYLIRECGQMLSSHLTVKADDEVLASALHKYHKELLTNNKKISACLFSDHGYRCRQGSGQVFSQAYRFQSYIWGPGTLHLLQA